LAVAGGSPNIGCTSDMELKLTKNLGASSGISGLVEKLSLTSCSPNYCESQQFVHLPYKAEIHETTNGDGKLTLSDSGKGKPAVVFESCGIQGQKIYTCTYQYSSQPLEFSFDGTIPAGVMAARNQRLLLESGSFCDGSELQVNATYLLHSALEATATESSLSSSEHVPFVGCTSAMTGPFGGKLTGLGFSCSKSTCSGLKALSLPYTTTYAATGGGEGSWTIESPTLEVTGCPFGATCKYSATAITLDVKDRAITAKDESLARESGICPATSLWNANYSVGGPTLTLAPKP
jgi:hypothetical protein